jgi:hypothetical protein
MSVKIKTLRICLIIGMGLMASLFGLSTNAATQIQVGNCEPKGQKAYPTIQAAVNAAASGYIINICPGTYPEQVAITKSLTLQGLQPTTAGIAGATVIVAPASGMIQNATDPSAASLNPKIAAQIFVQGAVTVNLANLIVDGSNNKLSGCAAPTLVGVYFQNAAGSVKRVWVRNETLDSRDSGCESGLGIYLEAGSASTGGTGPAVTVNTSTVTNYQKNGITANGYGNGSAGPVITFSNNEVVGLGPTNGAVQNGIQIGYGATGKLTENLVFDDISQPDTSGDPDAAATGILVLASSNVTVNNNDVGSTQFGIAVRSDPIFGNADTNAVTVNIIASTLIFDGVNVCSNDNTVQFNDIYSSTEAGIKVDNSCTEGPGGGASGNGNTVNNNNINGGCAGILEGSGTGNTFSPQILVANVTTALVAGDVCTLSGSSDLRTFVATHGAGHPVPFR